MSWPRVWSVVLAAGLVMATPVAASGDGHVAGEPVGDDLRVSRKATNERESAVAFNPVDEEFLVVWVDDRKQAIRGLDIFGQRVDSDGTLLGRAFRISGGAAVADEFQPAVTHNPVDNEYLVVWTDLRLEATRGAEIFSQRLSATGERLGPNRRVGGALAVDHERDPTVAYGAAGNRYIVFWLDARRPNTPGTDVFGQVVDADGTRVGSNVWITNTAQTELDHPFHGQFIPVGGPVAAYNSVDNEFVVAWPDRRGKADGKGKHIYGRRVAPPGERIGRAFRISASRLFDNRWAGIAFNPDRNGYLTVWASDIVGDFAYVFGRRIAADGARLGPSFRLSSSESFHVKTPSVVYDASAAHYMAVWQDDRNRVWPLPTPAPFVYGRLVAGDGTRVGPAFPIDSPLARAAFDPSVAYDPVNARHLVVWTDYRADRTRGADIWARFVKVR